MGYEKKEDYLQAVGQEIRWRRARRQLTRELSDHIADQEADFLSQGMDPQEAARRAVEEMGDPVEVGQSMNQLHRPKRCFSLPILALCASFAGLVCCGQWMDFYDNKGNQLLGLGVGLVLMGLLWLADLPAALKKLGRWVYGLVILCPLGVWTLFVLWPHHNSGVSSARFGLYLTLFFPLLFAALLLRLRGQGAWAVIAASLAAAWLAMPPIQFPNIGTAAILYGVMLFVLSAAVWNGWMGVKRRWLALPLLWTPGVLFLTAFFTSGLSTARFTYFFHPELDPTGYGYQWNTIRQTLDGLPFFFTSGALSPTQEAYLQSGLSHQSGGDFAVRRAGPDADTQTPQPVRPAHRPCRGVDPPVPGPFILAGRIRIFPLLFHAAPSLFLLRSRLSDDRSGAAGRAALRLPDGRPVAGYRTAPGTVPSSPLSVAS